MKQIAKGRLSQSTHILQHYLPSGSATSRIAETVPNLILRHPEVNLLEP